MRTRTVLAADAPFASVAVPAMPAGHAAAQGCSGAYLPKPDRNTSNCALESYCDLSCAEVNWGVCQLVDVNYDHYELGTVGGPRNGWTCDGIG